MSANARFFSYVLQLLFLRLRATSKIANVFCRAQREVFRKRGTEKPANGSRADGWTSPVTHKTKSRTTFAVRDFRNLVEVAGVEPASGNLFPMVLHA